MKSNDFVPRGRGGNRSMNDARPDFGIQNSESGVMPSAPVSMNLRAGICR